MAPDWHGLARIPCYSRIRANPCQSALPFFVIFLDIYTMGSPMHVKGTCRSLNFFGVLTKLYWRHKIWIYWTRENSRIPCSKFRADVHGFRENVSIWRIFTWNTDYLLYNTDYVSNKSARMTTDSVKCFQHGLLVLKYGLRVKQSARISTDSVKCVKHGLLA